MEKFFTISQTAKIVGVTTETLRHYDRIDLVKPCKIDEFTGYRYYSQQEIVKLNTVKELHYLDLTLNEIKKILNFDNLNNIIELLKSAEINADKKITELHYTKNKISRARLFYEGKLNENKNSENFFVEQFPQRALLLSKTLNTPSLDSLWDYHKSFYMQLNEQERKNFIFEDLAGIYKDNNDKKLFAVCTKYSKVDNLKFIPKGKYLCADCTEENKDEVLKNLLNYARTKFNIAPQFIIEIVVLKGILKWNYQIQILINEKSS